MALFPFLQAERRLVLRLIVFAATDGQKHPYALPCERYN